MIAVSKDLPLLAAARGVACAGSGQCLAGSTILWPRSRATTSRPGPWPASSCRARAIEVVPKLLAALGQERAAVREAAFSVLADLANEASAPGRDAERAAMTATA